MNSLAGKKSRIEQAMTRLRSLKATEAETLRALIDYLEAQQALGNLVYIRVHPVKPFTDKFGSLRFAKLRESQKGAADVIIIKRRVPRAPDEWGFRISEVIAIEIKSPKGKQSPDQVRWQKAWERVGGKYVLARTIDEALRELI